MTSPRHTGYTLMEILVAMTLLLVLGGGLVTILRQSVSIWRTAELRGRQYEQARVLLDLISEDLESAVIRSHGEDADSWIRFVADWYDHPGVSGSQRLRFVRAISGEMADAVLREGGQLLSTKTPIDYEGKRLPDTADPRLLRAPAGLLEVFYLRDPRPDRFTVWRGVRSPVGGPKSLFVDANVEPARGSPLASQGVSLDAPEPQEDEGAEFFLEKFASPVASQVLYLGCRFWTSTTNTWKAVPALARVAPGQSSGPSRLWDSTRALLTETAGDRPAGAFVWRARNGSLEDARDDVFPELVEVTVVIAGEEELLGPRLVEKLTSKGTTLTLSTDLDLDGGDAMVLVDGEWIAVEPASGPHLNVAEDGRGQRGTVAAAHDAGARVVTGATFRRVVAMPSFRSDAGVASGSRKSLRSSP